MTRRTIPIQDRVVSHWRTVDLELFENDQQKSHFRTLQAAVTEYVAGEDAVKNIAKRHALDSSTIRRGVNRCLAMGPDGRILGWAGLIPHLRVSTFTRSALLPTEATGGFAGAFEMLLGTYPTLRTKLHQLALKQKRAKTGYELNQQISTIHNEFLSWCTDLGIKAGEYPFSSKSKAKRSVSRLVRWLKENNPGKGLRAENRKDAEHRLSVGNGHAAKVFAHAPFDCVQMDAHRLHVVGAVKVPTHGAGFTYVPVQRMSLILVSDVKSEAILGYALVVRREPKGGDIIAAVNSAISLWSPRALCMPGMVYPTGGGLPSGLIPELAGVGWALLQVDNAVVHYATRLVDTVRRRVGFAINFGPFGSWERRPIVEGINGRLEQRGFQRLASSTGTGPEDPTVGDPNSEAVKNAIENRELIDIVELVIAAYNAKKIPAMGMKSPLMVLRDYVAMQGTLFLPRKLPPAHGSTADLSKAIEYYVIRGSRKEGRRPYIQFDGAQYTNAVIQGSFELIGHRICVHVNEGDMRSHLAFFMDGQELGHIVAKGRWNGMPWSREEGRLVRSLICEGELNLAEGDDPIYAYHCHLAQKSQADAHKQNRRRPKTSVATTKIERIRAEGRGSDVFDTVQPLATTTAIKPVFGGLPLGRFGALPGNVGKDHTTGDKP